MRLKDVTISANTGLDAIKRAPIVEYDTGLKCIRIQDISQGKDYESWGYTITTRNDYNKFRLKINDLLIARTGATVGVSYLVNHDYNAVFNNGSIRLRLNKSVNTRFVYYVFQTFSFKQYIDNVSCVATQPNLRVENLLRFTIPDFSLDKQNKIANLLKSFDDVIEVNNKRIKVLEQMAENLYKEWFVRFRFPGYKSAKFENGIPKGWKYQKLEKLLDVRYGKEHKNVGDGDIPIFGSGGLMRFGDKALYNGEVVLIPRKGSLNNIMYYNVPFWTVDTMFYAVPLIPNFAKYAYFLLSNVDMESYNSGAALPSMTTDILYHFKILVPDGKVLMAFDRFISDIFAQKQSIQRVNENLIKQRDLLLPRLMSGKLEI